MKLRRTLFYSIIILTFILLGRLTIAGERIDIVPKTMENINQRYHYSPAVKVGRFVFIAGQVGRDANLNVVIGKEAQIKQAFENLKTVLNEASASFEDVVEIVTYHTDMRDLDLVVEIKDQYFKTSYPTWTGVGVSSLSTPGLEFEIKATAYVD